MTRELALRLERLAAGVHRLGVVRTGEQVPVSLLWRKGPVVVSALRHFG
jgi:hypothetical protein